MRSKFERRLADSLEKRGIEYGYETLTLDYHTKVRKGRCSKCGSKQGVTQEHIYTPDFIIHGKSRLRSKCDKARGYSKATLIVEAKGRFTSMDRTKMKAVKERHPDADIRFVFMGNNKIHKNSDMRYQDWCVKHGFPSAIKEIPDDWI